jgi:hypothetical protein
MQADPRPLRGAVIGGRSTCGHHEPAAAFLTAEGEAVNEEEREKRARHSAVAAVDEKSQRDSGQQALEEAIEIFGLQAWLSTWRLHAPP